MVAPLVHFTCLLLAECVGLWTQSEIGVVLATRRTPFATCELSLRLAGPTRRLSFVVQAPLESPLVRSMMMIERRHGNAIKSTYHAG